MLDHSWLHSFIWITLFEFLCFSSICFKDNSQGSLLSDSSHTWDLTCLLCKIITLTKSDDFTAEISSEMSHPGIHINQRQSHILS